MFVASDEATSGSVMQNDERMRPFEQGLEPALFLLWRAVVPEKLHVAAVGRVAVEDLGGEQALAHLFGDARVLGVGQARAALRIGQEQVPQPLGPCLGLERLDGGRDDPRRPVAARPFAARAPSVATSTGRM